MAAATAEDVKTYQFDIDLPTINACKLCIMFLADPNMARSARSERPLENRPMKVILYEDETGEFRRRLEAHNGKTVADSAEGY